MKRSWLLLVAIAALFGATRTPAQLPLSAGAGPVIEAGIGYQYMRVDIPAYQPLPMNGLDASVNADFSRRFGVKLDLGYSRSFDAFGSGRSADVLSYLGGPLFYPYRGRKLIVYTELLLGGVRETGINYTSAGLPVTGFANEFAWAAGGGMQYRVSRSLSVRGGADYLRSSFFNSNVELQKQGNIRTVVSVIYTFGERE